ncbi:MAG: hypothetical protein DRO94_04775 [Candidatus Altiarchaeales archaeon]|nr:MAG: hypothetical protein DRO95_05125 [Candidatus Altiarchaeales archaeon]RLI93631.1 MAG: hypothetical protein DRO94_04775 [Candidatus Altiarchaeales archaeon]
MHHRRTYMSCKNCKRIVWAKSICPRCGGKTTEHFTGFVGVLDPEKSEIARKLEIKERGKYALKVRKRRG